MKKLGLVAILFGLGVFVFSVPGKAFFRYSWDFSGPTVNLEGDGKLFAAKVLIPFVARDKNPVHLSYFVDDKIHLTKELRSPTSPLVLEGWDLEDGRHTLHLTFFDGSLWGNETTMELAFRTDTTPLKLLSVGDEILWTQQGETHFAWIKANKEVVGGSGSWFEAAPRLLCSLLMVPIDEEPGMRERELTFWDEAGNRAKIVQRYKVRRYKLKQGKVNLGQNLFQKLGVSGFEEQERLRSENNAFIGQVAAKVTQERYFDPPFLIPSVGSRTSRFGQNRIYNGKVWHRHLALDLAHTDGAKIGATNGGKVAFAGPLGIYGNCVILDHGRGIYSLYAHNKRLLVNNGESVKKGQPIAEMGATGLAGGVHLHFSILVGGVYVNPDQFIQKFRKWDDDLKKRQDAK